MDRISDRLDKDFATKCWNWKGATNGRGYGIFRLNGKKFYVHRFVLMLDLGRDLTPDECACHRCDNPRCVNPDHLFAGTRKENMQDSIAKGRSYLPSPMFGTDSPNAKLSEDDVREIRQLISGGNMTIADISRRYGVSPRTIARIRSGERWRHLT